MIYFYILVAIVVLIAIVRVQNVPKEIENEENKIHTRARKVKEERARAKRRKLREETPSQKRRVVGFSQVRSAARPMGVLTGAAPMAAEGVPRTFKV